ncbi:MAG: TonB-dependent receptor [Candidatus Tenebribacter mawsonii]|nr:TonB-dependent receptor [Candidatus Tenebribacter mawsonii]
MKKNIIIFASLILISNFVFADQLTGEITDSQSGKSIDQVSVYVPHVNISTTSDTDGKYILNFIKPALFSIVFERIGYEKKIVKHNPFDTSVLNIQLIKKPQNISGMKVSSTKAKERETPVTFTNLTQENVLQNNFGQEIPMLMEDVPGVYSYSDAGGLVGNAHLTIRGFDQKRIGVMINGIPLNDPEDHNVYWVNMPDLAESTSYIQFQRGVGSSLYGISTFGGSLNMQTNSYAKENRSEIFTAFGSYNTYKIGIKTAQKFGNYNANIRFSKVASDGYRDNSASDLWSVFTNLTRVGERSITEVNFYTGHELTHAAWEASGDWELDANHQHNPYNYENYVDDFSQPHFELHHSYYLNEISDIKNSLFFIHGNGFYEQYKEGRNLWEHGLVGEDNDEEADIIRQKWITKNHYGWVSQFNFRHEKGTFTAGTYLSLFDSDHWGEIKEVIGADTLGISYESGQKYYNYKGEKEYLTAYVNEIFKPIDDISIMANLYFQHINYRFEQLESGNFTGEFLNAYEVDYNFFNPRFGINYNVNENFNIYGNISVSQREPTDSELYDTWDGPDDLGVAPLFASADTVFTDDGNVEKINWSDPYVKEEKLLDYEMGIGYTGGIWNLKANLYWMNFTDEIVAYGGADDEGNPIRGNADKTVHRGVELSAKVQLPACLELSGNFSYSDNYFSDEFILKQAIYDDETWDIVDYKSISLKNNTIAGFPDIISSGKLAYKKENFNLFTQLQYVGKQYLDNTENEDRIIDQFKVLNIGAVINIAKFFGKTDLQLNLRINNILNEEYETAGYYEGYEYYNSVSDSFYHLGESEFWPAAGRNFVAGLRLGF